MQKIDRHAAWIHETLLSRVPTRILGLARGPGIYTVLYGELNVFTPTDAPAIFAKAHGALRDGAILLLEPRRRSS